MALADNLISYYKLDTNNGTQPDSAGSNTGTVTGAVYDASGKINGCYDFDGVNDNIDCGTATDCGFTTESFTVQAWVKFGADLANRAIISRSDYKTDGWSLGMSTTINQIIFMLHQNTTKRCFWYNTSGTFTNGTWYHIVCVRTGTGGSSDVQIWANGVELTMATGGDAIADASYNAATHLLIGENDNHLDFDGLIDEVAIWERAITDAEVGELYNSGSGLQYPFTSGLNLQLNIGDDWKAVEGMQINIGDDWKTVAGVQINIGDTWRTIS